MIGNDAPEEPLGGPGTRLWATITDAWDLPANERAVLALACRTATEEVRLSDALDGASLLVTGSSGQQVANPLLEQLRKHRELVSKLLASLDLPDPEEEGKTLSPRSQQAQKAAQARWSKRGTG